MWLINTETLDLHFFLDYIHAPKYAILSHCWRDDEMTFKDFRKRRDCTGAGFKKIESCCRFAREDRFHKGIPAGSTIYEWLWVDTVCIDKRSSAELSEAINSMYSWYKGAAICYVYLDDYYYAPADLDGLIEPLKRCRWFYPGWTLQELLAPDRAYFIDTEWRLFGYKGLDSWGKHTPLGVTSIAKTIEAVTSIPEDALRHSRPISSYSVAQRMSWASWRETSRTEDLAYCLLGVFGVNMPLLYGEGCQAFQRLQQAILSKQNDETIYAWEQRSRESLHRILAPSPLMFSCCGNTAALPVGQRPALERDRGRWKLVISPGEPVGVFSLFGHRNVHGGQRLWAVRLACYRRRAEGEKSSHCVIFLDQADCGHLRRARWPSRPRKMLDEDSIEEAAEWTPVTDAFTAIVHSDLGQARECKRSLDNSLHMRLQTWLGEAAIADAS